MLPKNPNARADIGAIALGRQFHIERGLGAHHHLEGVGLADADMPAFVAALGLDLKALGLKMIGDGLRNRRQIRHMDGNRFL